jgi:hypothetical protein
VRAVVLAGEVFVALLRHKLVKLGCHLISDVASVDVELLVVASVDELLELLKRVLNSADLDYSPILYSFLLSRKLSLGLTVIIHSLISSLALNSS